MSELFGFPSEEDVKARAAAVRVQQAGYLTNQLGDEIPPRREKRAGPDGTLDGEVAKVSAEVVLCGLLLAWVLILLCIHLQNRVC